MDTVTQMLFGATLAQAGFRRRLGRRAVAAGAVVALVPDLDIVVLWAAGPFSYWVHHRGLTHSLLFGAVVGPLFGWLFWKLAARPRNHTPAGRSSAPVEADGLSGAPEIFSRPRATDGAAFADYFRRIFKG